MTKEILLGAHTSAAGGLCNALYEGEKIGATTIQMFTANQRQWKAPVLTKETVENWFKAKKETQLKKIMSHASFLINLGAVDPENLRKSREVFREEITRCQALDIDFLNFHPGSATTSTKEACIEKIIESLLEVKNLFSNTTNLRLLLETTAGQGSQIGAQFEELATIIQAVEHTIPIGVCIDTCHIFVAGYDIRTKEGWQKTLADFDRIIGLKHLYALHVNDSQKGLGSRVDRHEDIGKGTIGIESFKAMMQLPALKNIPKYLETPNGVERWKEEIVLLRSFYS